MKETFLIFLKLLIIVIIIIKNVESKPLLNTISKNTLIFEELKDLPEELQL